MNSSEIQTRLDPRYFQNLNMKFSIWKLAVRYLGLTLKNTDFLHSNKRLHIQGCADNGYFHKVDMKSSHYSAYAYNVMWWHHN